MCIICVELEKSLISPLEARRNLDEMAFDLDLEHFLEVEKKIEDASNKNEFVSLLKQEQPANFCSGCQCGPCDCDWGTNE
jgi:hypothetical protein